MTDARAKTPCRWGSVLRYIFGAALCLLAVFGALTGFEWYGSLGLFCGGIIFIYGRRRWILRAGVRRSGDEIVCRYVPLYEGYTYWWAILGPAFGGAAVAAGSAPDYPVWTRFAGIVILCVSAMMMFGFVRMWRRCLLCITPSMLRVRGAFIGVRNPLIDIRRDVVQAIEPKRVTRGNWLQVEVVYRAAGMGDTTKTVKLGPQGPQGAFSP